MAAIRAPRNGAVVAMVAVIGAVAAAHSTTGQPVADPPEASDVVWFASFLAFPIVGFLIAWHRPDNPVGWIFLGVGIAQAGAAAAGSWADVVYRGDAASPWGALLDLLGEVWIAIAFGLATTYPLLLLPDGRYPSSRWRLVGRVNTVVLGLLVVAVAVQPGPTDEERTVPNPLGIPALAGASDAVQQAAEIGFSVVALLRLLLIVLRWQRGDDEVRRRLAWLALAAVLILAVMVANGWGARGCRTGPARSPRPSSSPCSPRRPGSPYFVQTCST